MAEAISGVQTNTDTRATGRQMIKDVYPPVAGTPVVIIPKGPQMIKDVYPPVDTVRIQKPVGLSAADKKELIQDARANAAGWAIFGSLFSTLYFGLRSNNTIAKKYDLDPQKDKILINQIKREQMLFTLPALIPGFGIVPGVVSWLYNKTMNPNSIKLDGYLR